MSKQDRKIEDKKEACGTYIEQTKLLVALASAFLVAPAAFLGLIRGEKGATTIISSNLRWLTLSETMFVASVLFGYVVLGCISGSQDDGTYDVYRRETRISSFVQLGLYLLGLIFFIALVYGVVQQPTL
jgi:hypothetical protein